MNSYTLLCGTPGVHLKESCRRIREVLEASAQTVSYEHSDSFASKPVADYVQLPRVAAAAIWNEAVAQAIGELDAESDVQMMSTHLTLYERSKNVFFSPSRLSTLTSDKWRPKNIVLLIDDIFDMHHRLAEGNKIFSEAQIAKDVRQDTAEAAWPGASPDRSFTEKEENLFRVEARVAILNLLLSWRRQEMIIAENIASQLDLPLYLIGVKHPLSVMEVITAPQGAASACYISHPITSVRRDVLEPSAQWPPFARDLNRLPAKLGEHNIVGIMPTAIDELRFGVLDTDQVNIFTTGLRPRWPMVEDERIIDEPPVPDDDSAFVTSDVMIDERYVSGLLRGLWLTIANEVPFRDHYLVANTKHFLAFRPRENGETFSRGVQAEINHFSRLAELDDTRRMAIVHDVQDVREIVSSMRSIGDKIQIGTDLLIAELQLQAKDVGVQDLSDEDALTILHSRRMLSGLLSRRGGAEQSLISLRDQILARHAKFSLYRYLTGFKQTHPWCLVLIVSLANDEWIENVAGWFEGALLTPSGESALIGIDAVMSDDQVTLWIEEVYRWTRP